MAKKTFKYPPQNTKEHKRLNAKHAEPVAPWKRWGPYVSERAWGTVREDYSRDGSAWDYFPHDHARSRAYRWNEDGLAAICDRYQLLSFSLALWNGRDPILKERLYGVVPSEANHGEDVKEYYFYLDSTPTHSYMKFLYKYPQREYPYWQLIEENRKRQNQGLPEYELIDTGIFEDNRYFDVFVEYAKNEPQDICIRITVHNRGAEDATISVLPQICFRKTWGWDGKTDRDREPVIARESGTGWQALAATDEGAEALTALPFPYSLGTMYLYGSDEAETLFTNNETNNERIWQSANETPYVKDAFHRYVINGEESAVNPNHTGTKASLCYKDKIVPAGGSITIDVRLSDRKLRKPLADCDKILTRLRAEADDFYANIQPPKASDDEKLVQRQALAGMLWSKMFYNYDVHQWLEGDNPAAPPPASRWHIRNEHWMHLNTMRILSMPDKWEYPWFAAWDLAFHCVPLTLVDPDFAKQQLWLLLFEQFMHPSGQIPAYEWEFSDLNPPVQAWAIWRVYNMDKNRAGRADRAFLEQCFHKLLINFTWWVNKVDAEGNNVFEGGFLGLDNITVIDRSHGLPDGMTLEQSDGTGWMGLFCLNMMRIALELAVENPVYESLAIKFFQHYVYVGAAMKHMGGRDVEHQMWDEKDGFFYDLLQYPDGRFQKFRVRSLVGLIPLYAVERLEENWIKPFSTFATSLKWFLENRQDLVRNCVTTVEDPTDNQTVHVLAIVDTKQMHRMLECIWDPAEFRSAYGLRSLSKYHETHPFCFEENRIQYEPAESKEMLKGGNSNWRGPIWFPTTFMMIESLRKLGTAYGNRIEVDSPVEGEPSVKLYEMAEGFANRMISIFTRRDDGTRAVYGKYEKFQTDPHWRDLILFYEYFHGDTGMGLGAGHQTGWSGLVASLIDEWRR